MGSTVITVVTGPPCSGKTTYIREHAKPGDIVIDFDVIARALGSTSAHDHDPRLREITAAAWAAAVDQLVTRYPGMRAWVIDSRPGRARQAAYQRARARIVKLDAPAAELHRRAEADSRGDDAHRRIDEWTSRHEPPVSARTKW